MANWADRLAKLAQALATAGTVPDTSISTAETDVDLRLAPDGAGGVEWSTGGGAAAALQSNRVVLSSGDLSTASGTLVDATGLAITLTTGARRCLVGFAGAGYNSDASGHIALSYSIDTVDETEFLLVSQHATASESMDVGFTHLTAALTAAAHTFQLRFRRVTAGTATINAAAPAAVFWVAEIY